jgi:hypothetical protein
MAHGEAVLSEEILDVGGELEEAEGVGDGATVLAGATGDVIVAEVELVREAVEGMGDLDGVEILALYVLDQRDFEQVLIGNMLDHGRDVGKAGEFPGAPAAFASDELIAIAEGPNDERLNDAIGQDGIGEFLEAIGAKHRARLKGVGIDEGDGEIRYAFETGRRRGNGLGLGSSPVGNERVEALTERPARIFRGLAHWRESPWPA